MAEVLVVSEPQPDARPRWPSGIVRGRCRASDRRRPASRRPPHRADRQPEHRQDHALQRALRRPGQDLELPRHDDLAAHRPPAIAGGTAVDVIDLPGVYDLARRARSARSPRASSPASGPSPPDAVVVIVDACNLSRNLVLAGQLIARGRPLVVALNMVDLAERRGLSSTPRTLARRLGCAGGADGGAARRGPRRAAARPSRSLPRRPLSPRTCRGRRRARPRRSPTGRTASPRTRRRRATVGGARPLHRAAGSAFTHPVLGLLAFCASWARCSGCCSRWRPCRWISSRRRSPHLGDARRRELPRGRGARPAGRRHRRRHRRHGGVPAADLPAVLPHQPARRHRLPGARRVRDGPPALPLRPAGPRVRAAADVARLRAAGDHEHAADSRSPRSAGHDPRGAVHELLGAAAGVRPADQPALRRPPARRRPRVRRLLRARGGGGAAERAAVRPHDPQGPGPADDPRAAVVQGAVAQQRAAHREGPGAVVPQDRRHGDHGDLHRDVVAERVSEGRHRRPEAAALRAAGRCAGTRPARRRRRCSSRPIGIEAKAAQAAASPAASATRSSRCSRRSASTGSSPSACSPASSRARSSSRRCRCSSGGAAIRTSTRA